MFHAGFLKQIPLFNFLADHNINTLAASVRMIDVKQGQAVFSKGDEGTALYILKSGAIKIVLSSRLGTQIMVNIFSEGDFFGVAALLDGKPRYADAIAIKPSEVLVLRRSDFLSFLQSDINAAKSILHSLTKQLRKTHDFLEAVCFLTISNRLAKLIMELSKIHGRQVGDSIFIDLSFTQKELGDMIGATRESINRELKALCKKGIIAMKGRRIKICDLFRLNRQASF